MKIEFDFRNEKIPTGLHLLVDGKIKVNYRPSDTKVFAYEFEIFRAESEEQAREAVENIVRIMQSQSYDHGAEWRVVKIQDNNADKEDALFSPYRYTVYFRMRDSY